MKLIRFVLKDDEQAALSKLAEHEKRRIEAQACLIIRRELERLGLLEPVIAKPQPEQAVNHG